MAEKVVKFKIFRFDPNKEKAPHWDFFDVPVRKGMTVLDSLLYIQRNLDGTLAFRASCREGVCGSCAMHIAGRYRLACETQVLLLGKDTVTIRPLAHLPILKDLFVDFEPFWEKYRRIRPYLMPGNPAPERERLQTMDERRKLDKVVDCILCGCCYASCTVVGTDPNYLGPAALLKQARFVLDSRDNTTGERIEIIKGDDGAFRCHTIYNCQIVCPRDCDPTGGIAVLKREAVARKTGRGKNV